jgi:hypothetical protein
MKLFLLIIVIILGYASIAQNDAAKLSDEPCAFPKEGIVFSPPSHFVPSFHFNGYTHPGSGSSITVTLINNDFNAVVKGITETSLARNNLTLISREEITLASGLKAVLVSTSEQIASNDSTREVKEFRRILLFTEQHTGTVCLQAAYPWELHQLLYDIMLKSLLSVKLIAD